MEGTWRLTEPRSATCGVAGSPMSRTWFWQYGADDRWADAFRDEDEHRDAWIRNRDRLLAWYRHGHRPAAWWQFEAGDLRYPGYDREQSTLYQAGILERGGGGRTHERVASGI